ncbi:MAG: formate hydrogenlyase [Desulfitobacterium sp.]|nr:formate hydrogenlyase [Desulfitobacterium sp.]
MFIIKELSWQVFFFSVLHIGLFLLAAPLLQGWIKKVKAFWQMRKGPSVLQPYRDLGKFMRKEEVISEHTSWVFQLTPALVLGSTILACLVIPGPLGAPISGFGSLFWLVASFGLARFFLVLAGFDAGGSFGGMGSSRELFIGTLAEPGFILSLLVFALMTGSTSLTEIVATLHGTSLFEIPRILAIVSLIFILIAEMGRIPVDNPDTHLELTMVHEGMLLEYSGPSLAFLNFASQLKQLILLHLLALLIMPFDGGSFLSLGGQMNLGTLFSQGILQIVLVAFLGGFFATIESINAKLRLFRVANYLAVGLGVAVLALLTLWITKGGI